MVFTIVIRVPENKDSNRVYTVNGIQDAKRCIKMWTEEGLISVLTSPTTTVWIPWEKVIEIEVIKH